MKSLLQCCFLDNNSSLLKNEHDQKDKLNNNNSLINYMNNDNSSNHFPHIQKRNNSLHTDEEKLLDNSTKFNKNSNSQPDNSKTFPIMNDNKDDNILFKVLSPTHPPKQLIIRTSTINSKKHGLSFSTHTPTPIETPTFNNINFPNNNNNTFTYLNHQCSPPSSSNSFHSKANSLSPTSSSFSLNSMNQIIPSSFISSHPSLLLEEITGNSLNGNKYIITPCGYPHSKRNYGDGFVFFGSNYINSCTNQIINDILITLPHTTKINSISNHYFTIYFNLNLLSYFIRPFISSSEIGLMLIKLDSEYKLHKKEYIVIADCIFAISFIKESGDIFITKFPTKNDNKELMYKFVPEQGKITIGRNKNCSISFATNKNFSQVHTTFLYDKEKKEWFITDGGDTPSLNGTWLMLKHSYEIKNECVFKTAWNSKFVIKYVNYNK